MTSGLIAEFKEIVSPLLALALQGAVIGALKAAVRIQNHLLRGPPFSPGSIS
jgi:hypothetical protein